MDGGGATLSLPLPLSSHGRSSGGGGRHRKYRRGTTLTKIKRRENNVQRESISQIVI